MKLTRKMLLNGHCESATVIRGDLEYNHQLYVEHGTYFIRLIIREEGDIIVNRKYVARVVDCKYSYILDLFRQSVAWSGMCHLYSFMLERIRYDVFASSEQQARIMIQKMHGVPADQLDPLAV